MGKSLKTMPATDVRRDPVLAMLGVGRSLWEHESGDAFVERMRSEEELAVPSHVPLRTNEESVADTIWSRIDNHQGEQFYTVKGLPFTFAVEGSGIWFFRDGRRVNRKLSRKQVNVAISRCPLRKTTEINDLIDYPYLFAVLNDARIRGNTW